MTKRTIFTTDSRHLENDPYFEWLCRKVGMGERKQYFELAAALHALPFKPGNRIETDKNRAQDGLNLRVEFMEHHKAVGSSINRGACSMLEFLIGLAKRMSFVMCDGEEDVGEKTGHYFWKLIKNMRLIKLDDDRYEMLNGDFYIQEAVDRILMRSYDPDGEGGLFPLVGDYGDQRNVEIWYQMQFWLGEHNEIDLE